MSGCAPADEGAAGSPPGPALSFEDFRASVYREPWQGGAYIVEGDLPVFGDDALRAYYDRTARGGGALALVLGTDRGIPNVWGVKDRFDISYCVDFSFPEEKVDAEGGRIAENREAIVDALLVAAARWEAVVDVHFRHAVDQDRACDANNTNVQFNVRRVPGDNAYAMRAFFPLDERKDRTLNVDEGSFAGDSSSIDEVMTHELGHVLGFRHEQGRPEARREGPDYCRDELADKWIALTPADERSVMAYPDCAGYPPGDGFQISPRDETGAQAIYGSPGRYQPGEGLPTVSYRSTLSGVGGELKLLPEPFRVRAGSTFVAVLKGRAGGDAPNLFVNVGGPPEIGRAKCQPRLANDTPETCRVGVPSDGGDALVYVGASSGAQKGSATLGLHVVYVPAEGG